MTPPEGLALSAEGDALRLSLAGSSGRSADDAVGLVLLPVLLALVLVSVGYLLGVLVLALAGRDPALLLDSWRPGFLALGAVTWAGSTVWYRLRARREGRDAECTLAPEVISLGAPGGALDWRVRLADLERAEARGGAVRLVVRGDQTREIPLRDGDHRAWLAAEINQRIGALR